MNTAIGIGAKVNHPHHGVGIVSGIDVSTYKIFFRGPGDKEISRTYEELELIEPAEVNNVISIGDIENAVYNVMKRHSDIQEMVELGDKWKKGTVTLNPGDDSLKPKEFSVESFFHKIVMVRDRLRVLEQNINSHKVLTDEEKVHLQQYITKIYGSLTTFNVMFKYKDDHFVGESKRRG